MTALRMAKGIADRLDGRIAVIDTEARSASKYADRIPFEVEDLAKKTVDDYIAAMNTAQEAGYKVLVLDSLSHAWRELTDEVDRLAAKSASKNTFSPWAKVNPKQKRLVEAILNYPGHVIATMRSSTEWVVGENKNGKTAPEKIGLKPEQGKGIEYEFDLLVELNQQHQGMVAKDRTGKYQDEVIEKPGEDFGAALYDWLSGGNAAPVPEPAVKNGADTTATAQPKTATGQAAATIAELKAAGNAVIQELGDILNTASPAGQPWFSEDDKAEARTIVAAVKMDGGGIRELRDFRDFLAGELATRQAKRTDGKVA
jgi:hypothetical protein